MDQGLSSGAVPSPPVRAALCSGPRLLRWSLGLFSKGTRGVTRGKSLDASGNSATQGFGRSAFSS
jgi:hypothetical protein